MSDARSHPPVKDTTLREMSPESRQQGPRVSLVFYFREGAKIVVPTATPMVVGRSYPADVIVDDPSVSRAHARFALAPDGGVTFEDLGSTNGTKLNGAPATQGRITPGDELRVGDVSVALHVLSTLPGIQGLVGYDAFLRMLDDELVRSRTFARPTALLMVGARAPGHPLRRWAPSLLDRIRPVDRAAVYAADTVLIGLAESTRADAEALGAAIAGTDAALRFGVATFPQDGTSTNELLDAARTAMMRGRGQPAPSPSGPLVVGERMRAVWEMVDRVASATLPVLVHGETGSGKEVVARALHERSSRREGPLRSVNCAAIPQTLVESVLFGHERGAFTGADRATKGLFEQAHGGTLLLDEVGELPAGAQAALLRVLETKRLVRVGGDREIQVDVRVVAATHRDLEAMAAQNTFRMDLYYRLQGVTLVVPPLRERPDEVRPLADAFLRDACRENGRTVRGFDPMALAALGRWRWPGNVRELKNVVERAVVIARGDVITLADLPDRLREAESGGGGFAARGSVAPQPAASGPSVAAPPVPPSSPVVDEPNDGSVDYKERLRREMSRYERQLIVDALARAGGNVTNAATALKIPVRTLTHKMQALGIKKKFDADE